MNFFSSDHHFGHDNVLKYCAETRPFRDLAHMHESYVASWNEVVTRTDTVWYLGDFSLRFTFVSEFLHRLNGTKRLVVGNHDSCFELRAQQTKRYLDAGFSSVERLHVLEIAGLTLVLNHFPYRVDEPSRDPAVAARQLKFASESCEAGVRGEHALIHGHVHQHWRARMGASTLPELNVAVDVWEGRPVSEAQIVELYREAAARETTGQLSHQGNWQPLFGEGGTE